MKDLLLYIIPVYFIVGSILAFFSVCLTAVLYVKTTNILNRGNMAKIEHGPTFNRDSRPGRVADFFFLYRGLGGVIVMLFLWPLVVFSKHSWKDTVTEVEVKNYE